MPDLQSCAPARDPVVPRPVTQCIRNQTLGFAELPSKAKRVGAVTRCLARWGGLLARFVQSAAEQDALLTALTRHCDADDAARSVFEHVTKALYDCDEDLLGEEAIERWAAASSDGQTRHQTSK